MADKRKLQGEIDRCIKKVAEGVALFEDVWQKVQTAPSLNQKEKFEADLKKEIKKLQRLRDQIKTWLASNDIKDKRQLTENRKIIEAQMERFKVVERETKTKAYSKEGLGAATKVDPKEKEKEDAKEWVTQCIDTLQLQKDQFESEIEGIENKKKGNRLEKDKQERIDELKNLLVQHQEHIDCLELVLRGVDNDQIDLEQLKKTRDSVEYYVESHDTDSGDLSIYDDLHLDALRLSGNAVGLTSLGNDDDCLSNSSDPPIINPSSPSPSTNHSRDKPHEEEKKHASKSSHVDDKTSQQSKASAAGLLLNCVPIPITPTKRDSVSSSLESTTPDAILRTPPPVAYAQAVSGNQQNSRTNSTSSQPSSGSAGNSRPASQSAWTATESKQPSEHGSVSSTVPVTPTAVITPPLAASSLPGNSAVNGIVNGSSGSAGDSAPASSSLTASSSSALPPHPAAASTALLPVDASPSVVSPTLSAAFPAHSTSLFPTQSASDAKVLLNGPSSTIASLGKMPGHPDLSSLTAKLLSTAQQQDSATPASLSALTSAVFDNLPPSSLASSDLSNLPQLLMQQQQGQGQQLQPFLLHQQGQGLPQQQGGQGPVGSQQQQTPLPTTTIHLSPLLGVAPLGTQPLTKEQHYQMALLDTANMHLPYPSDSERLRFYLPRNPCPAPPYYPQAAPAHSDAVEFYQKLGVETLFFIFYYMEGTKAQYLAAKALKKQSWRFHTKYMMWFQRHEEPKLITEDYEQGTYVYFDYEKWCQRKKEGFTFEYRFLEDRDLN